MACGPPELGGCGAAQKLSRGSRGRRCRDPVGGRAPHPRTSGRLPACQQVRPVAAAVADHACRGRSDVGCRRRRRPRPQQLPGNRQTRRRYPRRAWSGVCASVQARPGCRRLAAQAAWPVTAGADHRSGRGGRYRMVRRRRPMPARIGCRGSPRVPAGSTPPWRNGDSGRRLPRHCHGDRQARGDLLAGGRGRRPRHRPGRPRSYQDRA